MKKTFLTLILLFSNLSAFAKTEQTLTCTRIPKQILQKTFNYDQQIEVTLSYSEKEKHRFQITGKNLKYCSGRVTTNFSPNSYVGFNLDDYSSPNKQHCGIYDLTVRWYGNAVQVNTKAPITISSYNYYVSHGEADYNCVSKTN